jgi:NCS1 family nucleobase:cation symporter-1
MFTSLLSHHDLAPLLADRAFSLNQFLLAMSLSASWQIAYGPYVADYSRYLPANTPPRATFLAVGAGSVLGSQISMSFGVLAAALGGSAFEHHEVAYVVGLGSTGAIASALFFCIAFGKVMATSLNSYGSFMSIATILGGFHPNLRITRLLRLGVIAIMVTISIGLALAGRHSFLKDFEAFILFLLAVFTPWSAINLVDYYAITRSGYDLAALDDPDGRYGRWNKVGLSVYLFGILVQLPFIASPFYTGPMVAKLGGADISWIIGLVLPALLYFVLVKLTAEKMR